MLFSLDYIGAQGKTLSLSHNPDFVLSGVDGMTSATVAISSTEIATVDGAVINNARAMPRSIVLYMTIRPGKNVEAVKREVLSVIKPKKAGTLRLQQNARTTEIVGTVENVEMPRFTDAVVLQVTLFCASPYWQDADYIVKQIELVIAEHSFEVNFPSGVGISFGRIVQDLTRSFENFGDAPTGAIITIIATGDISDPLLERTDGAYFGLDGVSLSSGESIVISTEQGRKTVTKNGENIMSKIRPGSTWFQMEVGENIFTASEAGGSTNLYFTLEYKQKYV